MELVVVSKYTKTRKKWLRAKIVKSNHGKHNKKKPLLCTVRTTTMRKRIGLKT